MVRKVLVATPAYDFRADVRFVDSLLGTLRLCMAKGIELRALFTPGNAIIHDSRNELVAAALQYGFDDLIFIDSDQDWQPQWVLDLLDYPVDCVGAPVRKKTDELELYNVKNRGGIFSFHIHPDFNLLTADDMALGTGFIRYSRKALQLLWHNSEPYSGVGSSDERRMVFDIRVVDGELVSEDTHVSTRLRELGIDTWLDPNMNPGHIGQKRFEGRFADWLQDTQAEAVAKGQAPDWYTEANRAAA